MTSGSYHEGGASLPDAAPDPPRGAASTYVLSRPVPDHLENPFDQIGEDDVVINAEKFAERLALDEVGQASLPDRAEALV